MLATAAQHHRPQYSTSTDSTLTSNPDINLELPSTEDVQSTSRQSFARQFLSGGYLTSRMTSRLASRMMEQPHRETLPQQTTDNDAELRAGAGKTWLEYI